MTNLNNQAVLNLPKLIDGSRVRLTGDELFNSRELHMLGTKSGFEARNAETSHVLKESECIITNPIYEQNVDTDGSLDGGIAVKILTDAEFGSFNDSFVTIANNPINVTPILDSNGDELLTPEGDQVYGILGIQGSAIGTDRKPVDNSMQLSFTVKNDDVITPVTIEPGDYFYYTPAVYAWSIARWRELPLNGITSGMGGTDSASVSEIVNIINANTAKPGYANFKLTADSNKPTIEGYKAVFTLTTDGSIAPSFKITSNDGGIIYTSVGTMSTEGIGIIAETGTASLSNITFTINGEVVDPQYVSVTVSGLNVEVTLDNSTNEVTKGDIYAFDSYNITYNKPAGA